MMIGQHPTFKLRYIIYGTAIAFGVHWFLLWIW